MNDWVVITDCGMHRWFSGRTALAALREFPCPRGESVTGILAANSFVDLGGFRGNRLALLAVETPPRTTSNRRGR